MSGRRGGLKLVAVFMLSVILSACATDETFRSAPLGPDLTRLEPASYYSDLEELALQTFRAKKDKASLLEFKQFTSNLIPFLPEDEMDNPHETATEEWMRKENMKTVGISLAPKFFIDRTVSWSEFDSLLVLAFSVKDISDQPGFDRYEASYIFRDILTAKLSKANLFRSIDTNRTMKSGRILRLEGQFHMLGQASTKRLDRLFRLDRLLFRPEGATYVGVQAEIVDPIKQTTLFKFVHFRSVLSRGRASLNTVSEEMADIFVAVLARKSPFPTKMGSKKP